MRDFHDMLNYSAPGPGGTGGGTGDGGGTPPLPDPLGAPGAPPASPFPWAKPDDAWKIADKPWFEHLPDGPAKETMKAKNYGNPVVLAEAYNNLNKSFVNKDKMVMPPDWETAKPEDLDAYFTRIGRPANKDAYDPKFPDGFKPDPAMLDFAKDLSFNLGLPPKLAQTMVDKWNGFATKQNETAVAKFKADNDAAVAALSTKYGADLDKNKAAGLRVVEALKLGNDEITGLMTHIGAAPVIELLVKLGRASDEGTLKGGGGGGGGGGDPSLMSPDQAAAEIVRLRSDATFTKQLQTANDPDHLSALQRWEKLHSVAGNKAQQLT